VQFRACPPFHIVGGRERRSATGPPKAESAGQSDEREPIPPPRPFSLPSGVKVARPAVNRFGAGASPASAAIRLRLRGTRPSLMAGHHCEAGVECPDLAEWALSIFHRLVLWRVRRSDFQSGNAGVPTRRDRGGQFFCARGVTVTYRSASPGSRGQHSPRANFFGAVV
jgi:hypothetical protein